MPSPDAGQDTTAWPGITFLALLAVLLPALAGYAILYRQALPVPYQDDYAVILSPGPGDEERPRLVIHEASSPRALLA